jgi:hypothetical protein
VSYLPFVKSIRNFRCSQNKVALDALRAQVVAELAAQQSEAAPSGNHPEDVQEELRRRPRWKR